MSRNYCFTDFNEVTIERCKFIENKLNADYIICGGETCPDTGKKHIQGYMYFRNKKQWKPIAKIVSHVEQCKKPPEANIRYCSKEQILYENGTKPNQGSRTDLKSKLEELKEGTMDEFMENHPEVYCQYRQGIKDFRNKILKSKSICRKVEVIRNLELNYIYKNIKDHFTILDNH